MRRQRDLQGPDTEHQGNRSLFLPRHLQISELEEWNAKHPEIQRYAYCGIGPGYGVETDALALVFAIPLRPYSDDTISEIRLLCFVEDTYKSS